MGQSDGTAEKLAPMDIYSLRKLFAANIGRRTEIEACERPNEPRGLCGEVFSVGNSFVSLIDDGKVAVAELITIKSVSFE